MDFMSSTSSYPMHGLPTLTTVISGWGRYPMQSCKLNRPERYAELCPLADVSLAIRGQGRSYGDAALNQNGHVMLTERINRLLEFDMERGILRAEAGITLAEILEVIIPGGWFIPITPGTKFVSLGGCVAADVHGKNHHHDGSFGDHILKIELILADGSTVTCSPTEKNELYWATVGGMGLTGIIGEVTLKLIPIQNRYMIVRHHAANSFEQLFQMMQDISLDDRYTVAWIDTMAKGPQSGRGIMMCGHHALAADLPAVPVPAKTERYHSIPFNFPEWVLNSSSIRTFNALYYWQEGRKQGSFICDYDSYFYPLDTISHWNRMYGKRGFLQYQCVLPDATAYDGIRKLLATLAGNSPSFLAVLKRLGKQGSGLLSFPLAGYTLALDLPIRDEGLFALLQRLDEIVLEHGGRVYLAKDARLSAASFRAMYPRYTAWLSIKNAVDPQNMFSSSLSRRLEVGEHTQV